MEDIFIKILNMSITASYFALALFIIRAIFRKMPKWISCLLWGLVGLRLIIPFSFESILSIIPSAETVPYDILISEEPHITSGIPILNSSLNPIINEAFAPEVHESVNPLQVIVFISAVLWIAGIMGMLLYALISYMLLQKKTNVSFENEKSVFICDNIDSPFILGVIKPRIYIPSFIDEDDKFFVLAHEKAHIKRKDYLWKPLGFLILSLHWFNPLMWLTYILLCRDIEGACDEKVIKEMDTEKKKSYSNALITCSVQNKYITACPLAFGETGVKSRIKNILSYKKPALWIIIITIVLCIVLSLCFITNPAGIKIDDIDAYGYIFDETEKIQLFIGSGYIYSTEDTKPELSEIKKVRLEKIPLEETRDTNRDKSYRIEINDKISININEDFSVLWLDDSIRPSYSYKIKNPEVLKNLFSISNYVTGMEGVYVNLRKVQKTDTGIIFTAEWHNERDEAVEFGEIFSIERLTADGTYETVEFPENFVFILPAYILNPGDVVEKEYYCPISLKEGDYRFSVTFSTKDDKNYYARSVFIIDEGTEAASSSENAPAVTTSKTLTLDDVTELSQKGEKLSWDDFDGFSYYETGSGLYIRIYKIDEIFSLAIGGIGDTQIKPIYIYLKALFEDSEKVIDIRNADVKKFIEDNKSNRVFENNISYVFRTFPVDSSGANLDKIISFASDMPQNNFNHIKSFPVVRISNYNEMHRFCEALSPYTDFSKAFSDTDMTFKEAAALYTGVSSSATESYRNFFEDKDLLIMYITASNEYNRYQSIRIFKDNDNLYLSLRETEHTEAKKNNSTGWLVVFETEKAQLADVNNIEAFISETVFIPDEKIEGNILGNYVFKDSYTEIYQPNFTIYDNGSFVFEFTPFSSYYCTGTYARNGDKLILYTRDGLYTYAFTEINGEYIFDAENSSSNLWNTDITDGSVFS